MNKFFLIAVVTVTFSNFSLAQKPRKFGEINKEELQMEQYDVDPDAKAVVLYEYGASNVNYGVEGLVVDFTYHKIVKILDDDELDRANITLTYPDKTRVGRFKAATYNLSNGKIVESELSKKEVHTEKLVDGYTESKFSFPDVKVGSVIEYTYHIETGNIFFLNSWTFQTNIPVKWSEYIVEYPSYLIYKTIMRGYVPLSIADVSKSNVYLSGGGSTQGRLHRYVAKDVPAFEEEKYMNSKKNYISKIEFELQAVQRPGYYKEIFSDFNGIQKLLIEDVDFGMRLKKVGFMKEEIETLKAKSLDPYELAKAVYNLAQKNTTWDGDNSLVASTSFRRISDEEVDAGTINLYLVALLRLAGLDADPVIISTRNHGMVHPTYALIKNYNYVIGNVVIGDRSYLVDATDDYLPFGVLPERCLNGKGRLISENGNYWVDIKSLGVRQTVCSANFDLNDEGELHGNLKYTYNGYKSYSLKKEIKRTGVKELMDSYAEVDGWEIDSSSVSGQDDLSSPLIVDLNLTIGDKSEALGDVIYLTPMIVGQTKENPFKMEERQYPVDFTCPRRETYVIKFKIPEGYEVDAVPKPLGIALPEKAGKYIFTTNVQNDYIVTMVQYQINKPVFQSNEYAILKEYFAQIVNKESEQIVLKAKL